jgi:hypothetical protein
MAAIGAGAFAAAAAVLLGVQQPTVVAVIYLATGGATLVAIFLWFATQRSIDDARFESTPTTPRS